MIQKATPDSKVKKTAAVKQTDQERLRALSNSFKNKAEEALKEHNDNAENGPK